MRLAKASDTTVNAQEIKNMITEKEQQKENINYSEMQEEIKWLKNLRVY